MKGAGLSFLFENTTQMKARYESRGSLLLDLESTRKGSDIANDQMCELQVN